MRRITKGLLALGIVAVVVAAYFVLTVAGYRVVVDDMNDEGDAYDDVDTDDDGTSNVDDDDIDGDGIDNDVDTDDDNDGVQDDEDEDPIIPNDDENNNGIPDVLEPIAVMKISDIDIKFCVIDKDRPRIVYTMWEDGYTAYPTVTVLPYTGTAEPVYDWVQGQPLTTYPDPVEVEIEYFVRIMIQSDFRSMEYVYEYEDGLYEGDESFNSDTFYAVWESDKFTKNAKIYTDTLWWDMSPSTIPEDAWNYINVNTGNCYLWEAGVYNIVVQVFASFTIGDPTSSEDTSYVVHDDGLYIPSFEVIES